MFSCPFVSFHFTKILNVPKTVGQKITIGLRPGFFSETGLPPASPSFISAKVDTNGVGKFEKESILSLPTIPGIIDFFRLEFVAVNGSSKQIISARVFETKELMAKKGKTCTMDIPFFPSYKHPVHFPNIKAEVKIEITGSGRCETLDKENVIKKLSSSISKGKVSASAFKTLFTTPPNVEPSTCPDEVEKIAWVDFPLLCTPHDNFTFGIAGSQFCIDKEYEDTFVVHNRTGETVYFQIGQKHPNPPTYELKTEPTKGILDEGKDMTIKVKLILRCTTSVSARVPIRVWGKKWDRGFQANIYIEAQGTLSTKLDPAEIIRDESKILGDGSFGVVYQAKYRGLPIAAKYIKPRRDMARARKNFEEEVQMFEKLRHPCIVQFIGAVHFDNNLIIALEYCSFGSLGVLLDKESIFWKENEKDVTMAFRIHAMLDVARALTYLHESNIIHRDVKPDNVLIYRVAVTNKNDLFVPVCKLTDFGTTKTVAKQKIAGLRKTKQFLLTAGVGSEAYFSPEICEGKKNYNLSSDVFSFAMSAYEVLTDIDCTDFFEEELLRRGYSLNDDDKEVIDVSAEHADILRKNIRPSFDVGIRLDPSLKTLIQRCWETDPNRRPPISQVSDILESAFCEEIERSTRKPIMPFAPKGKTDFDEFSPASICFDDEDGFVIRDKGDEDISEDYDD